MMAREPGLGDRLKGKEETEVWGATWVPACVSVRLGDGGRGGGTRTQFILEISPAPFLQGRVQHRGNPQRVRQRGAL